jgi:hypothetical protein
LVKLSCKSCGAKLELTDDIDRFSCASCGSEWLVNRSGGIVSLKEAEESLKKIEKSSEGTERHAEVLANQVRLEKIMAQIARLQDQRKIISLEPRMNNPAFERRAIRLSPQQEDQIARRRPENAS